MSHDDWMGAAASAWAVEELHPDPFVLPASYSIPTHAARAGRRGRRLVTLTREEVRIAEPLSGEVRRIALNEYSGLAVTVAAASGGAQDLARLIVLTHADPACCLPLYVDRHSDDLEAMWRAWSCALNRPLLVGGEDMAAAGHSAMRAGVMLGGVAIKRPAPRRMPRLFLERRSLLKRTPFAARSPRPIRGDELIARN